MSDRYSPRPMGALRVSLLGSFRASVGDAALPAGGVKQRAVLAMLALRAGDTVPESRLIDGIWGDETPSAVRSSLQVYVAHWRRVLGESGAGARIEREGVGYRLVMEPADVDVNRYASLVALGRAALADERFVVAASRFDEAQALWRGDALQDFEGMPFHQWETVSLESARVQALADRSEALLGAGRGSELVALLEGLVARYPFEERFSAQLMHALYRSGRQVDALRVCEQTRSGLVEVGIEVGPLLRSMEQRVLQQDPSLESKASPFTPASPPEPLTSLIGREQQVADLVHLSSRGGNRLVTLTGPGGVGKSRLVLEVANRVVEEGWMPVAYLALNEALDASVVPQAINGAFGVPESWRERPVAEVARMLGDSPLLVVVDGAEHVLGAVRNAISDLLQHGRQLHVLVTSRVALGLNGERQVPLDPLVCRADGGVALRSAPAVALFIERAERFQSGLVFDDDAVRVIAEICEGVDGLPLAIELAAARSGTMGVDGLRRRLGSRLDLLAAPHQAGMQRHRSLREVIAWSHGLLSVEAQRLLARLSVLSGGFELEHVEEMWGDLEAGASLIDSFEELDRHSMLARVPGQSAPRFRLLDTVREFAVGQLAQLGVTEDAYLRLLRWVHARVDAVGGRVGAGAKQFDHLALEVDNARAAVAWALEHASADTAADLCNKLYVWWMGLGRRVELLAWMKQCLTRLEAAGVKDALLLLLCGLVLSHHGSYGESNDLLRQALAVPNELTEDNLLQGSLCLAENLAALGDCSAARSVLVSCQASPLPNKGQHLVRLRFSSGFIATLSGDFELAKGEYRTVIESREGIEWPEARAKALAALAEALRLNAEFEASLEAAQEAVLIGESINSAEVLEFAFGQLALTGAAMGDIALAVRSSEKCLGSIVDGDPDRESIARAALASSIVARLAPEGTVSADLGAAAEALLDSLTRGATGVALTRYEAEREGSLPRNGAAGGEASEEHPERLVAALSQALKAARSFGTTDN